MNQPGVDPTRSAAILDTLARGRAQHFLGPGPLETHIEHSLGFAACVLEPATALDLGSGGGVPGLVLARLRWPATRWVLVEARERRCEFLRDEARRLGVIARVEVRTERAEVAGRDPALRGTVDVVVARGFGRPAVTAECAAPFLRVGGHLVVSEPPGGRPQGWTGAGLTELGLERTAHGPGTGFTYAVFRAVRACPDRFPRRTGLPAKRPLF